jgi:Uma2 family endonuclease
MPRAGAAFKLSYDDYLGLPDDGNRHELIAGEHLVSPAPTLWHQRVATRLLIELGGFAARTGCGEVLGAPVDVVLSPNDVVQPDILFFARGHEPRREERMVARAPDLVIEVSSSTTRHRDHGVKRRLYERAGVREYWIIDPERATATVHRLTGGRYASAIELAGARGDALTSPLVPGWRLPLADLHH